MARQSIDVGSAANDGTGDSIRVAFQKCNSNFGELSGSFPPTGVSKYTAAWAQSHNSVSVANGSTHTITHNLATNDINVTIWVNTTGTDIGAEKVDGLMDTIGSLTYGAFVTSIPSTNTCVVQLGDTGYASVDSTGSAIGAVFTSAWLKIIVIG